MSKMDWWDVVDKHRLLIRKRMGEKRFAAFLERNPDFHVEKATDALKRMKEEQQ